MKKLFKKTPHYVYYILGLYLLSRLVFTIIGYAIQNGNTGIIPPVVFQYSGSKFLDIWTKWDTNKYILIADGVYFRNLDPNRLSYFAFFPMYSIFIRVVDVVTNNKFIAGWIISNISIILSSFVLYKLAKIDFNEKYSLQIIKYLYLLPMGFIFSAIFSESLFLLFLLLSVYMARKQRWFYAGLFGILLSLTKPHGLLIIILLIIEYLKSINYSIRSIKIVDMLTLLMPFIGTGLFCLFCYTQFGDPFAFVKAQHIWGHAYGNPIYFIVLNLFHGAASNSIYALLVLVILINAVGKIRFSYWSLSMLMILAPLTLGVWSIPRYSVHLFSIPYILTRISNRKIVDIILTLILITLQIYLFVIWQIGSFFTV